MSTAVPRRRLNGFIGARPVAERERLEELASALAKLDEASSEFDRLVQTENAAELLEELGKLSLRELRRILFGLVLIEQRGRGRPTG